MWVGSHFSLKPLGYLGESRCFTARVILNITQRSPKRESDKQIRVKYCCFVLLFISLIRPAKIPWKHVKPQSVAKVQQWLLNNLLLACILVFTSWFSDSSLTVGFYKGHWFLITFISKLNLHADGLNAVDDMLQASSSCSCYLRVDMQYMKITLTKYDLLNTLHISNKCFYLSVRFYLWLLYFQSVSCT